MASHLFTAQQLRDRMLVVFTRHAQKVHTLLSELGEWGGSRHDSVWESVGDTRK